MKYKMFWIGIAVLFISLICPHVILAEDTTEWSLPEGAKARLGKGAIIDMQLSSDGSTLAVASSIGVRLYDVDTSTESVILTKNTDLVGLLAFSPDSSTLAYCSGEKKCYVWDVAASKLLRTFPTDKVSFKSLKILADGKTLVGRPWQDTFLLWDITTGELKDTTNPKADKIRIKGDIWHPAIDGIVDDTGYVTYAIGNRDGTISIQEGRTNQLIRTLESQTDESAFLKVGADPPEPLVVKVRRLPQQPEEDDVKHIPSNFRKDGKPFPIQYKLDPQWSFRANLDKQPIKWITELKFSPDGKLLMSKSSYKIPRWDGSTGTSGPTELWNVETGEQLAALPWTVDVQFADDSNTLAISEKGFYDKGKYHIWDMIDTHQIATFEYTSDMKFSGNGKSILMKKSGRFDEKVDAVIDERSYAVWDIATQAEIASVKPIDDRYVYPGKLFFSQDGSTVVTENDVGTIDVWKIASEPQMQTLATGYTKMSEALAFSDDEKILLSGTSDFIHVWDTVTATLRKKIKTDRGGFQGITIGKDNKRLTTIGFGVSSQWDFATGELLASRNARFGFSASPVTTSFDDGTWMSFHTHAYAPDSTAVAAKNSKEKSIEVWNSTSLKRIGLLKENVHNTARGAMALAPDGNILATNDLFGKDSEVFLWDTKKNEQIGTIIIHMNLLEKALSAFLPIDADIRSMVFDFSGETLAIATGKKHIQLWNITNRKRAGTIKTQHKHAICKMAFAPDGKYIASGDTMGDIHVWESTTGKHVASFKGHKRNIGALAFSRNNTYLASVGLLDGVVFLWDVPKK